MLAAAVAYSATAVEGKEMQPLHRQQHCSSDDKWELFSHPEHRICVSVATVHLRKVYAQIFLCNTYQIQIHLKKTEKHCYYLFTWLVTPLLVNQPETTERWSVSPAFAWSALQTLRQRDFFLPSLREEPEARSREAKPILQQPLKPVLNRWNDCLLIELFLRGWEKSRDSEIPFYFLQIFLPRELITKTAA